MSVKFFVHCDPNEYLVFDGRTMTKSFFFEANGEHILSSFPIGGNKPPRSVRIHTSPFRIDGQIFVTRWRGVYELSFSKLPEKESIPNAILQKKLTDRGFTHVATLLCDDTQKLMIENGEVNAVFPLKVMVSNPKLEIAPVSFGALITLTGKVDEREYLMIVSAKHTYKLLLSGVYDEIRFERNSIILRYRLNDMLGRIITKELKFSNEKEEFETVRTDFDYENDRAYVRALTPYLLLEAIKAGDEQRAQRYLADGLSAKTLKEYLGEFESIEFPKYSHDSVDVVAILVKDNDGLVAKEYKFELSEGKISNIYELEYETA